MEGRHGQPAGSNHHRYNQYGPVQQNLQERPREGNDSGYEDTKLNPLERNVVIMRCRFMTVSRSYCGTRNDSTIQRCSIAEKPDDGEMPPHLPEPQTK